MLLLAALCAGGMYGQNVQQVAICIYGNGDAGVKKVMKEKLMTTLYAGSDSYEVKDLTSDFLKNLQNVSQMGNSHIAEFGRQYDVNRVCAVKVSKKTDITVTAEMIDVETGERTNHYERESDTEYMDDWKKIANDMVAAMTTTESDKCRTKDQPEGEFRCCDDFVAVGPGDGNVCRDVSGEAYWLLKGDFWLDIMAHDKGPVLWKDAAGLCPYGWTLPTYEDTWSIIGYRDLWGTFSRYYEVWTSNKRCAGGYNCYGGDCKCDGREYVAVWTMRNGRADAVYVDDCNEGERCIDTAKAYVRCVKKNK
jgi:hypothetical protein